MEKKEHEVRELVIDPSVLEEMRRTIEKTGELQICSAPDPTDENKKINDEKIEIPPKEEDKPKKTQTSTFCCGKEIREEKDFSQPFVCSATPYSMYSVCINS